jgi:hypothetical protein
LSQAMFSDVELWNSIEFTFSVISVSVPWENVTMQWTLVGAMRSGMELSLHLSFKSF